MSLPYLCPPCWELPWALGTLAAAHGQCSGFAAESTCSYFWAVTAFSNICLGVSAWPRSQLGLPPLLAAVRS